ncbi:MULTISPECIES: redox-sensitive transcriptional activator SoxR [unclassified Cryobacterium]|uniref:redox-sensitive transcriptional activator SoxR n=1 Tax=unclassified Cryobacterium TaxID=2649013 RepID=UPI00106C94DF|nr:MULTISPECIES: redox-sensitive transcriptional activator SoxR [unclassified Cryobacterium]TFC52739.1 redox-sensitive transcriptional activator SoxR [Cryobacterium sp. TMB3-1-2]TFC60221.1 redox-sensitive transcriptional activator SoxR [Cryobacterium sp. TMB1-7]TFC68314.1 redox-sensitive transcriptional activator SoxR [Cryobacterium sp. TMB3-15]TFC74985.1 redox-sensitive transcriptional activator SoxR [Cryobacterium sp. TMB3-10]TFC92903.1 redox-sensitive transcriptional activator SoxR [Cryobac
MSSKDLLPIGQIAARAGVPVSTVRYYETLGLIPALRSSGNVRLFPRHVLRRIALIQVSVRYGISLAEVAVILKDLPDSRPPSRAEWGTISATWGEHLARQQAVLERMQAELTGCIGCGCLSQTRCAVVNSDDRLRTDGAGPRRVLDAPKAAGAE